MFERAWVQIPAPYTGWTFFALICCKHCIVCLKRPKINEKEGGVGPFLKKNENKYKERMTTVRHMDRKRKYGCKSYRERNRYKEA